MINLRTYPNYISAIPIFKTNSTYVCGPFDNTSYPKTIKSEMNRIYKEPIEHGVLFTPKGVILKKSSGDKDMPFKSKEDFLKTMQLAEDYPGNIFLHNHPEMDANGHPLSITPPDGYVTAVHDGSESIVVHPNGTYSSLKFKENISNYELCPADRLNHAIYSLILDKPSFTKEFNQFGSIRNKWWIDNADKLGVIYTCTHDFGN